MKTLTKEEKELLLDVLSGLTRNMEKREHAKFSRQIAFSDEEIEMLKNISEKI